MLWLCQTGGTGEDVGWIQEISTESIKVSPILDSWGGLQQAKKEPKKEVLN